MLSRTLVLFAAALLPWVTVPFAGSAAAQDTASGKVLVELNKMEDRDGMCRAYFIVRNRLPVAIQNLELDAYLFGTDGVIADRILLAFGGIAEGRTRIFPFDLAPDCASYEEVLVDSIIACEGVSDCADVLVTSSRAAQRLSY